MQLDTKELKKISVLYVEDDDSIRKQTVDLFEKIFKQVFSATDGEEGLSIFKDNMSQIDIVITDINMPNKDGLSMIKDIHGFTSNIPIIITTAHNDSEHLKDAIDLNVDKYISKPIQVRELTVFIVELVTKYKRMNSIESLAKNLVHKNNIDTQENEYLKEKVDFQEKELDYCKSIIDNFVFTIETDKYGVIESVSKKFSNFFNFKDNEIIGKNINDLKSSNCKGDSLQQLMLKSIHTKKSVLSEQIFNDVNGTSSVFDVMLTPLYGEDSFVTGYKFYLDLLSTHCE